MYKSSSGSLQRCAFRPLPTVRQLAPPLALSLTFVQTQWLYIDPCRGIAESEFDWRKNQSCSDTFQECRACYGSKGSSQWIHVKKGLEHDRCVHLV